MATRKKPQTKKKSPSPKKASSKKTKPLVISIDLKALDRLYKQRYVVSLDGGDTKGGSVRKIDGDTKGGVIIRPGDRVSLPKRPSKKSSSKPGKKKSPRKG